MPITPEEEVWRRVPRFPRYAVSSLGRVRNIETGRILRPRASSTGYLHVTLYPGRRDALVHTLVPEAFVGPRPDGYQASHLDDGRTNNRLVNLCWETLSENNRRKYQHGTMPVGERHFCGRKTSCKHGHPFTERNTIRRPSRQRQCRACGYRRFQEYRVRRRNARRAAAAAGNGAQDARPVFLT